MKSARLDTWSVYIPRTNHYHYYIRNSLHGIFGIHIFPYHNHWKLHKINISTKPLIANHHWTTGANEIKKLNTTDNLLFLPVTSIPNSKVTIKSAISLPHQKMPFLLLLVKKISKIKWSEYHRNKLNRLSIFKNTSVLPALIVSLKYGNFPVKLWYCENNIGVETAHSSVRIALDTPHITLLSSPLRYPHHIPIDEPFISNIIPRTNKTPAITNLYL